MTAPRSRRSLPLRTKSRWGKGGLLPGLRLFYDPGLDLRYQPTVRDSLREVMNNPGFNRPVEHRIHFQVHDSGLLAASY
jgi:hypothetical protein